MTRRRRIALEIFLPPVLGTACSAVYLVISVQVELHAVHLLSIALFYLSLLVPNLIYALLMEKAFKLWFQPQSRRAVAWSTVLGPLLGCEVGGLFGMPGHPGADDPINVPGKYDFSTFYTFSVLGLLIGFAMGLILYFDIPRSRSTIAPSA